MIITNAVKMYYSSKQNPSGGPYPLYNAPVNNQESLD